MPICPFSEPFSNQSPSLPALATASALLHVLHVELNEDPFCQSWHPVSVDILVRELRCRALELERLERSDGDAIKATSEQNQEGLRLFKRLHNIGQSEDP